MSVNVRQKPKGSGDYWIFINHNGKRKAKKIGKNRRLAKEIAKKIEAKLVLGALDVDDIGKKKCPTFKELSEQWLNLPSDDRRQSTIDNYNGYLRNHVYPDIGDMYIDEIKRKHLILLFSKLRGKGFSKNTLANIRAPIKLIFEYALDLELVEFNVMDTVKVPRSAVNKANPLEDIGEVWDVIDAAKTYKEGEFYLPIYLELATGLRIGELQPLTYGDLDLENGLVWIKKSYRERYGAGPPKNKKDRSVKIPDHLITEFQKRLSDPDSNVIQLCKKDDLLFTTKNGQMISQWKYRKAFRECLKSVGLTDRNFHQCRHTFATLLARRADTEKKRQELQRALGHANYQTTQNFYIKKYAPDTDRSEINDIFKRGEQEGDRALK